MTCCLRCCACGVEWIWLLEGDGLEGDEVWMYAAVLPVLCHIMKHHLSTHEEHMLDNGLGRGFP